jgi:outer membrane immunogenic protein
VRSLKRGSFVWYRTDFVADVQRCPKNAHYTALMALIFVAQRPPFRIIGPSIFGIRVRIYHVPSGEKDMRKYLRLALASAVFVTLGGFGSAQAADMAVKARPAPIPVVVYNWTGFYVGINGGGGWSRKCWDLTNNFGVLIVPPAPEGCHDATGGTVGGQIGYRWQASNWVFGVEAQGNWADFNGSNLNLFFPLVTDRSKIDAFGLLTGQIGYAWNNVLVYVKGGAAVVRDKYSTFFTATGVTIDTAQETRWGGVVGVGGEYGFTPNWSVAIEYDHMFMGTRDVNALNTGLIAGFPAGTFSATDRIRQDVDLFTVRVNYRFGGPIVAKY